VLADGEIFCRVRTPDGREGYMMKEYLEFENGLPPREVITPSPAPTPDLTRQNALARGVDPNKPMLALTFDDGPHPDSLLVVEALEAHGARGTFFVLGKNIQGNEEVLRRIAQGGHQIGAHTWSHPNLREISQSAVRSQITRTMDKIQEVTGQTVTMLRPPYGALNRLSRRTVTELGLPVILWSVDSLDWKTRSASKTIDTILSQAQNGAIILCHDVWDSTGRAMQTLVPALIEKGYQLVTVAEMMSFRNEPLKPGWEYSFLDTAKIEPGLTPMPQHTPAP
jgi:peptidoglycan/xylan/chitin deacetylase (PgdA/CDA1 family)